MHNGLLHQESNTSGPYLGVLVQCTMGMCSQDISVSAHYLGVLAHELLGKDISGLEGDVGSHSGQEPTPVEGSFCYRCHGHTPHNGEQGQDNGDCWGVPKESS